MRIRRRVQSIEDKRIHKQLNQLPKEAQLRVLFAAIMRTPGVELPSPADPFELRGEERRAYAAALRRLRTSPALDARFRAELLSVLAMVPQ